MKKLRLALVAGFAALALGFTAIPFTGEVALAGSARDQILDGAGATGSDQDVTVAGIIRIVTNVLLFIIGAVAVIMMIIGGLKYVTANGDSNAITSAKNTILYAAIGIGVAIAAYAIVGFVIGAFVAEPDDDTSQVLTTLL